jgi:glutamate N-acetyltransferase / amino-acid N-acetyltransferase
MDNPICKGFLATGISAGIKKDSTPDLGLIVSEHEASVAAVFTKNKVKAAPVMLDQERVKSGICRAVIVNSGNANCCTGKEGMTRAVQMARAAANALKVPEDRVMVASTGVIGEPLPIDRIEAAAPRLAASLKPDGWNDFAGAIMTTDTFPKLLKVDGELKGKPFSIIGTVKGAGMIHPDMATMLAFICTDAQIAAPTLHDALASAVTYSFNRITVDGDTSTNDTALVMANGASGVVVEGETELSYFKGLLSTLCMQLARLLVKDAEGANKLVDVVVRGALTDADALSVAKTVAGSNLVKTAFFGEDANWGRIIGAVGRAGVKVDPDMIDILFDDVMMVKNGTGCGKAIEEKATLVLEKPEFTVTVDLNLGKGGDRMVCCDFSIDYVKINADYRS